MNNDAVAAAIVWLTGHHGQERSKTALFDSIGLPDPLLPNHAVRALREAGFRAATLERSLADIHPLLLPVVLLLEGGDACVLIGRVSSEDDSERFYDIVLPARAKGSAAVFQVVGEAELASRYSGWLIAATPQPSASGPAGRADVRLAARESDQHWLWGSLRRFLPYYRATMLAALLSNVLMLATGLVTAVVFDKVIPHQAFTTLWALAAGGLVAVVFDLIARQLRSHLIDTAGKKCDLIIGSLLFRHTLGLRMEHRPESAGVHSHHVAQIETVRDFFASATVAAFTDLPFIVLFIAMTFMFGGPLGWVLVAAVPLLVGMALMMQRSLRRSMHASLAQQADLQGLMVEALEGIEDLKTTGAQGQFLQRFERMTGAAAEAAIRARKISSFTSNVSAVSQPLITLIILVWGVYLIDDRLLSSGAMIACVMFSARAVAPLSSVVSLASRYQGARAAMLALDRLMSLPQEREPDRHYVGNPVVSGRIGLSDVSFSYPPSGDDPAPVVLHGVSLKFSAGERVAILGRIGSGKSTVLRVLAGLYQPVKGYVDVDGMDLRQIDPADFRACVGFVSQEPRLFKGTLRDNVLMGRASADATRLTDVAALTGLDRLVAAHPQGWEMQVGEMGSMLSGGQRQLVALARALVTRPRILLMDEPTSSMDAQSEQQFLQKLHKAVGECTLIMVTHRPAVLDLAQRVIMIEGGKAIIDGPRAKVLEMLAGKRAAPAAVVNQVSATVSNPQVVVEARPAAPSTSVLAAAEASQLAVQGH